MPIQFVVTSIEWERVHLTMDLLATWSDPGSHPPTDRQPIPPRDVILTTADLSLSQVCGDPKAQPYGATIEDESTVLDPDLEFEDVEEGAAGWADSGGDDHRGESLAEIETLPSLGALFISRDGSGHDLDWAYQGDGHYRVHINISAFEKRQFLPNGSWEFCAWLDDGTEAGFVVGARWELDSLDKLDACSRVFLFSENKKAYTVSFGITESDTNPLLVMHSYAFGRGGKRMSVLRNPVQRGRQAIRKLKSPARKRQVAKMIYERSVEMDRAARALRGREDAARKPRILFASEMRAGIEGNLLAVRDRMIERGLDSQYDMRFSFRKPSTATSLGLVKLLQEMGRADVILLDDFFPPLGWLDLNPETKIIQLWHAGSGFKSIGYSRFGKFGSPALDNAHRKYTYTITGSHNLKHVYSEAFGLEEEVVIPTGLPRIDAFLDPDAQAAARRDVYATFPQLEGKRVILFAPTFRGRGARQANYPYDKIDFEALYELCGEDTVVAFRMHHFIPGSVPIPEHMKDRFIDVGNYRNGNNLLLVTDLLITDYSSIIYEYSLLDRPMLFFAYDEEVYSSVRGFHRPYRETAPGKVCNSFDELLTAIRDEDFESWRVDQFRRENFDYIDTHSSDRVIDWLILGDPPAEAVMPRGRDSATVETFAADAGNAVRHNQQEENR